MFYIFHVQQSTFIQIQSCHLLLVAAQGGRAGFHLTGAYFCGRAYITSILKNHTSAYFQVMSYFQGNRVTVSIWLQEKENPAEKGEAMTPLLPAFTLPTGPSQRDLTHSIRGIT